METTAVVDARTPSDYAAARTLIEEYAAALGVSVCVQNLTHELDHLSELYTPPSGGLLLARCGDDTVGCVAIRPFDADTCEMKRLYVRPAYRRHSTGRQLAKAAIERACANGYSRIVLDTLSTMDAARGLYRSLGFKPTKSTQRSPLGEDVVYMELEVASGR